MHEIIYSINFGTLKIFRFFRRKAFFSTNNFIACLYSFTKLKKKKNMKILKNFSPISLYSVLYIQFDLN